MRVVYAVFVFCFLALPVSAQTTLLNPTQYSFTASADHGVKLGTADVLTSYKLVIVKKADSTLVLTVDLGKPTPGTGNTITGLLPAAVLVIAKNVEYIARVDAVGPGGVSSSAYDTNDPFGFPGSPAPATSPAIKP